MARRDGWAAAKTPPQVSALLRRLAETEQVNERDIGVIMLEQGSWFDEQILCDDGYDIQRFASISADFVRAVEPVLPDSDAADAVTITFISFEHDPEAGVESQSDLPSPLAGLREFLQQVSQMLAPPGAEEHEDQPDRASPAHCTWIRLSCTQCRETGEES